MPYRQHRHAPSFDPHAREAAILARRVRRARRRSLMLLVLCTLGFSSSAVAAVVHAPDRRAAMVERMRAHPSHKRTPFIRVDLSEAAPVSL